MNRIKYIFLLFALILLAESCSNDITVNENPNQPSTVTTSSLILGTQKKMTDNIFEEWFSGRQGLLYPQYWSQRNYTEEDRYQVRENTNNASFYDLYTIVYNYQYIIDFNTNEETRTAASLSGNNNNQIAVSRILKAWMFHLMTDVWGDIPYTQALRLNEYKTPKYDKQEDIYADLIKELTESANMINENEPAFITGDVIYNGDASKWKKFANSLKCRIALRTSKVDPQWRTYIQEALTSGVFQSNADVAKFKYSQSDPNQCYFYRNFFVDNRNDFSLSKTLMDYLKGQRDTLNNKNHPWEGVEDPRLRIYTTPRIVTSGKTNIETFVGIPYGVKSGDMTDAIRDASPTWDESPPLHLNADFSITFMSYAELCFILSEYEGYSSDWYEQGVRASLSYWSGLNGTSLSATEIEAYVSKVNTRVDVETLALQKYLDLYMNGYEAWSEYRRTGYPSLLKPGEINHIEFDEEANKMVELIFDPMVEVKGDIPARVKYPTIESTLNGANFKDAVSRLQDGTNNMYSKMFWHVRDANGKAPANK